MRIAMVSDHADPLAVLGDADAGGQNVHVAALSRALAGLGHEVTVYTRRDDPSKEEHRSLCPGVTVTQVPAGPARRLAKDDLLPHIPELGRNLAHRFRFDAPDVVHSHFWMSAIAARMGIAGRDIPLLHTFHALGTVKRRHQRSQDTSPRERIWWERRLCVDVDHVIATCTDEVDELRRLGARTDKVSVVPCGVDVDAFTPWGPVAERSDRPRLVTVGRMVERKGYETAIAAMARIPDAELVVVGGPPPDRLSDDDEARRLLDVADAHDVSDRVTLTGAMSRDGVAALMRSADAVLCTPWYEPFGIVPLEAAACGKPVVGSAVGGLLDTVVDGDTGLLVSPRQPAPLARAVRDLLDRPTWMRELGGRARERVEATYTWPRVASDTADAYDEVRATTARPTTVPA